MIYRRHRKVKNSLDFPWNNLLRHFLNHVEFKNSRIQDLLFYLLNCSVKIWCWSRYANNVKFCVKTWYEFHLPAQRKSFDLWRWQTPQNAAKILGHNMKISLVSKIYKTKAQKLLWNYDKEMFCSVALKQSMIRHKSIRPFKLHLK